MEAVWLELLSLFSSALLAATLLPVQSEIVLVALHLNGKHSDLSLLCVATAGNVLGAVINWLIGRYLLHFQDRKWFPVSSRSLKKAEKIYQHYGLWSLFFAWLPFIGDPLTIIAGLLRTRLLIFIVLVTIGKAARYAVLISIL